MDPINKAASVCAVMGSLHLLVGGLLWSALRDEPGAWIAVVVLVGGVVFLLLAWGIFKESMLCALVAAVLYTGSFAMPLPGAAMIGALGVVLQIIRLSIALALWKGVYDIWGIRSREAHAAQRASEAQEREDAYKRQAVQYGSLPPSFTTGSSPEARRSGRRPAVDPSPPPASPSGPKMTCPNCRSSYPPATSTCERCRVPTFED